MLSVLADENADVLSNDEAMSKKDLAVDSATPLALFGLPLDTARVIESIILFKGAFTSSFMKSLTLNAIWVILYKYISIVYL
jgi:hypothetical protein